MFSDPEEIIQRFELIKASHVADFGSGSGFYSFAAAEAVGENGVVYSIDVQKDLLQKLKNEARNVRHLTNIEIIWGDVDNIGGTKLKEGSIDAVIAANIFFQLENKENACLEIKRILKSKGRVLLVDWINANSFNKEEARKLFIKNGFAEEREIDAGVKHYGLIFIKI
ncbi:MAG: methyltransferase domain-containing protein [Candidatus Paceibacterota bacterium]|jgi:ubiquinone/menaquinone biosynthesis C-methylase UbiE